MNYVESFNMFGMEVMQLPCVKAEGAPTTATAGAVGLLYMDTNTGDMYKCISVTGTVYTWVPLVGSGESIPHVVIELNPDSQTVTCNYTPRELVTRITSKKPVTCVVTNNRDLYHANPCLEFNSGSIQYKLGNYVITADTSTDSWNVMVL